MKKLSIFLSLIALFVCIFALTVSAEALEWSDVTVVEGMSDKASFGADGTVGATSRVLMSDGKTYPAYYIFKDSTTLTIDYTALNKATGLTYSNATVVRLEIPEGIVTLKQLSTSFTSLYQVVVPEGVEAIVDKFLCDLASVTEVTLPSTVKSIGTQSFYKIGAVESFVIPEGCTSIGRIAFKLSKIKGVVIPSTIESMSTEIFIECSSLETVVCRSPIISKQSFKSCTALKSLTLENTVEIGEQAFHSCGPVESVVIPSTCTTINAYAFKNSQILSVTVPSSVTTIGIEAFRSCTSLKEINHHAPIAGAQMYRESTSVEKLNLEGLVEAQTYSFYGLTSLKEINLPETLVTVGDYSFARLTVETIVTPASLVNVGKCSFYAMPELKCAVVLGSTMSDGMFGSCSKLYDVVITPNLTSFTENPFSSCAQNGFTIYFTGEDYTAVRELTKTNMRFNNSLCAYADFDRADFGNKNVFVYSANLCDVVYDTHLEDNNPCVIICDRCGLDGAAEESPVHSESIVYSYVSFDKAGERAVVCTNPGCQYKEAEAIAAIFTYLGHSVAQFGESSIVIGYVVNNAALLEYTSATGKTISYGVFVGALANVGDSDAVNADGTYANGVFGAKVSENNTKAFQLKISGFTTDEQMNTQLVLGAYVIEKDENGASVSYMQMSDAQDGARYFSISYNEILAK